MVEHAEAVIHDVVVQSKDAYSRENWPHLGKLVMYLLLAPSYNWHSIRKQVIEELFRRDASLYLITHKHLQDMQMSSKERLRLTFECTQKSRRHLMFQFAFFKQWGPKDGVDINKSLDMYHRAYGGYELGAPSRLHVSCFFFPPSSSSSSSSSSFFFNGYIPISCILLDASIHQMIWTWGTGTERMYRNCQVQRLA
ncbi:hypothetical protein RFI_19386 [Reticulomyxa filosa]|uniref:Uncharacterized protein n=1 Tax=Reticulomyxa filosa TaxID=46433 RepID=X6MXX8_RETFI|nr:hypothetical protein RFI_19386 [Reticulomyxa filosa]|eukprot:ETO17920.1 hypothetical protein RFI_19386 [Reticulomyxa filosa]